MGYKCSPLLIIRNNMKIRQGFVSNSSSSSFVIIQAGESIIVEDGDSYLETTGEVKIKIDDLIAQLIEAKHKGAEEVTITHGGGYDS